MTKVSKLKVKVIELPNITLGTGKNEEPGTTFIIWGSTWTVKLQRKGVFPAEVSDRKAKKLQTWFNDKADEINTGKRGTYKILEHYRLKDGTTIRSLFEAEKETVKIDS